MSKELRFILCPGAKRLEVGDIWCEEIEEWMKREIFGEIPGLLFVKKVLNPEIIIL